MREQKAVEVVRSARAGSDFRVKTALAFCAGADIPDRQALFDQWTATGFLALGPKMLAEQDKGKLVMDVVDEQLDVSSKAFLGLTVGCARCHDHKYDPIPTTDYYSLAGVFLNTEYHEYPRAPKAVVTNFEKLEHEMEQKQKVLGEMQNNLSKQLSETLALQTASYLQGVFEITGSQKRRKRLPMDGGCLRG
jgi:cytochrome c553